MFKLGAPNPSSEPMVKRSRAFALWMMHWFNPPPLASMTFRQKLGRVFCIFLTLLVVCIVAALTLAALIFVVQQSYFKIATVPELLTGLVIIVASFLINAICVAVLIEIRKLDSKIALRNNLD
jgi:hypothetical protein